MNNVMLDLETWGKRPGCAIRSIGAAIFDPYGTQVGSGDTGVGEFYCNVSLESCRNAGLKADRDTEAWWKKQGEAAQAALIPDQIGVVDAAGQFCTWFAKNNGVFVWSQGAGFDEPIIAAVLEACGHKQTPWKFWDVRDTRTAYDMGQHSPFKIKRVGIAHHALHDARHQIRCVQAAYRNLGKKS